jgi:hypothetical protein
MVTQNPVFDHLLAPEIVCLSHFLPEAPRPFAMTHSPNNDPLLDQIVTTLKQQGLHTAALTLLEAGQPLTFIGSQLLWLLQPTLTLFWPSSQVGQLARLMEDPAAVNGLMHRLATDEAAA